LKSLLENEEKKNVNNQLNKSYINKPPISNYNANNVKDVMSNKENYHKEIKGNFFIISSFNLIFRRKTSEYHRKTEKYNQLLIFIIKFVNFSRKTFKYHRKNS